ncbi:MAG: TetR family transcriptional regulator [Firmicutes bacterium]|nr:TetR family transcriptional regulator [Bacillota bacterium]
MGRAKQRYYAAIERAETATRMLERQQEEEMPMHEFRAEDQLYADIGARAYRAFANILDSLGDMAGRTGSVQAEAVEQAVRRSLEPVVEELRSIRHKLEQQELVLHEVGAGIRRIDKFTLEAFQRMQAGEGMLAGARYSDPGPGRLSKEETTERALKAARELKQRGERLTLKAVARRAGLRYAQVVYAFGRKEELLQRLESAPGDDMAEQTA